MHTPPSDTDRNTSFYEKNISIHGHISCNYDDFKDLWRCKQYLQCDLYCMAQLNEGGEGRDLTSVWRGKQSGPPDLEEEEQND